MVFKNYQKYNIERKFTSPDIHLENMLNRLVILDCKYIGEDCHKKKGELIPYHSHPSKEHLIVIKGSLRYNIEEELVDLKENQLIILNSNILHSIVALEDNTQVLVGF